MYKYSDYTNEISQNEIFNNLISCGLFAEKLPDFGSPKFLWGLSK